MALLASGCQAPARWALVGPELDRAALCVWAPDAHDQFVVGGGLGTDGAGALFLRGHDGSFSEIDTTFTETLWWVWGTSASDVWLAGERGLVAHFNGATVTPVPVPDEARSATLFGIWGASAGDVWAVGRLPDSSAIVLRGDVHGFGRVADAPTLPGVAYFKVWGSSARDVFFVGEAGVIAHYDGAGWARQPSDTPTSDSLFTVAGRSSGEVYAVGGTGRGLAFAYDGVRWSPLEDLALAEAPGLNGVAVGKDGELSIVGFNGTRLHGRPGALKAEQPELTRSDLHATFVDEAGVIWAVGGNFLAPAGATRDGLILRYGP